jgi:hypothetical protein
MNLCVARPSHNIQQISWSGKWNLMVTGDARRLARQDEGAVAQRNRLANIVCNKDDRLPSPLPEFQQVGL